MISNDPRQSIKDQLVDLAGAIRDPLQGLIDGLGNCAGFIQDDWNFHCCDAQNSIFSKVYNSKSSDFTESVLRDISVYISSISFALNTLDRATSVFIDLLDGSTCATTFKVPTENERLSLALPAIVSIYNLISKWKEGDIVLSAIVAKEIAQVEECLRDSGLVRAILAGHYGHLSS